MRAAIGTTGGRFSLAQPLWTNVIRGSISLPDFPTDARNDHYRTLYFQNLVAGPYQMAGAIPVTPAIRLMQGISNGVVQTIFDVPANGVLHAAVCGSEVKADAAVIKSYWPLDAGVVHLFTQEEIDNPTPQTAIAPGNTPEVLAGMLQNQALSLNRMQTPKRTLAAATTAGGTVLFPVPAGAQTVRVVAPSTDTASQRLIDAATDFALPIGSETPLLPDASRIVVTTAAGVNVAVVFSLGI